MALGSVLLGSNQEEAAADMNYSPKPIFVCETPPALLPNDRDVLSIDTAIAAASRQSLEYEQPHICAVLRAQ